MAGLVFSRKKRMRTKKKNKSMHTQALELLDNKGRPMQEMGVWKIVYIPQSPAEILVKLFGDVLSLVSAVRWSVMGVTTFILVFHGHRTGSRGDTDDGETDPYV